MVSSPHPARARRWPISLDFLLKRLFGALIAIWGALTIVFLALNLTGDPVSAMVSPSASSEDIERMRVLLGYDRPLIVQYLTFMQNALTGHFPNSLRYSAPPLDLVLARFPNTLLLALCGMGIGVVLGLGAGYLSVFGKHWITRQVPLMLTVGLQALPPILLGVILVLIFAVKLRLLPTSGFNGPTHIILPAFTLGIYVAPAIARVFRASMLDAQNADHVRTALSKGIPLRTVRLRHIVANAMIPVANQIGLQLGAMIGGAVVIETIFSWPGIGQLAVGALTNHDYPLVLATVAFVAVGFAAINFLVDVLSVVLDPRLRAR